MKIKGLETITSDNKNLGTVIGKDKKNKNYFVVYKKGIITDQEFHISIQSIKRVSYKEEKIYLNLNELQVKHGFEYLNKHKPASFLKSDSESTLIIPLEKEKIRFQAYQPFYTNTQKPGTSKDFICDMCPKEFVNNESLKKHRLKKHKPS